MCFDFEIVYITMTSDVETVREEGRFNIGIRQFDLSNPQYLEEEYFVIRFFDFQDQYDTSKGSLCIHF